LTTVTVAGYRKAFDGALRISVDGSGTVYTFPDSKIVLDVDEGVEYPDLVDASALQQNAVLGFVSGRLTVSGVLNVSRNFDAFLNTSFGARTAGTLAPQVATILPASGVSSETVCGLWWNELKLMGRGGERGAQTMIRYEATGFLIDPHNALSAAALGAGTGEGAAGSGLCTFASTALTNGAGSPTVYDSLESFSVSFMNRLKPILVGYPGQATNRLMAGYIPSQFYGIVEFEQLSGRTVGVPLSGRNNPLTLKIPAGDASVTLTLDMCGSYNGRADSFQPDVLNNLTARYRLFGTSSTNGTGGAGWPFHASVG
jgi:hypothetical protein